MTKCPRCFHTLTPDRVAWTATTGDETDDPVASSYHGAAQRRRAIVPEPGAGSSPTSAAPDRAQATQIVGGPVAEICPFCHYPLADGWRDGEAVCIGMAGNVATGKSVYLAVMIKALQLFAERIGFVVEPADRATEINFRENFEWVYERERGLPKPTAAVGTQGGVQARNPMVFRLGTHGGRRRFLVVRDVSGEDLGPNGYENATSEAFGFFSRAHGVIFMFDPLKVPSVANQLKDLIPAQDPDEVSPGAVLNTVLKMIGRGTPQLAVVLSKFDVMHELAHGEGTEWSGIMANAGAGISRDPSMRPAPYDQFDAALVDAEVRSLLMKLGSTGLVAAATTPNTGVRLPTRFFAVSALGGLPAGERVNSSGIAPFRCLDPTRWILANAGVWN